MEQVVLSNKAKAVLESDYFKSLHKKMALETKRSVLNNEINSVQVQMDGLCGMLGYKPVMAGADAVQPEAEEVEAA